MTKYLESTGIRQNWAVPVHEVMKTAQLIDQVGAGTHGQMIRVGQNDLRAQTLHGLGRDALDVGLRAHRHENGGLDIPVRRVEDSRTRMGIGILGYDIVGKEGLVHLFHLSAMLNPPRSNAGAASNDSCLEFNIVRGLSIAGTRCPLRQVTY